ncbi:hypothetical protein ANANG_G00293200 [Anguilla anguilla]|uniref:Uncharacterized protein n=1 Tax=Anguilla anguilla TaxID=7936 RepID=A0A9D3RJD1_ANGAN|nr:hypothetical protein ANANG_G00293200 [Anguilla anguilla]
MGRLDDAAKRKVVELRQAGLSFRKIKAVLELENIKVSAQAIYLFLKEFKGKSRPKEAGGGAGGGAGAGAGPRSRARQPPGTGATGRGDRWAGPTSRCGACSGTRPAPPGTPPRRIRRSRAGPRAGGRPSGEQPTARQGGRMEQQGGRKEDGIRIVSVTSLARGAQHGGPQMAGAGTGALMGAGMRRKAPMSPASSAILVARKRLLDKALLHKARMREMSAQPGQQAGQLYGRGQACFQGNDARKVSMLPQTSTLDLTSARLPQARGGLEPHPVPSPPKRTLQRPGPPARSLHPPFQRDPPPASTSAPQPRAGSPAGQGHGAPPGRSRP